MTEIYILISLWCTNPAHYRLTEQNVDDCREKALKCVVLNKKLSADANRILISECISKVKLGNQ